MTQFKTILFTAAAVLALPGAVLAQVPTDAATTAAKEKVLDKVMDNMTTEDAMIAGTTMIKGGSKEDAAIAVVKNRADKKIGAIMGDVSPDNLTEAEKAKQRDEALARSMEKAKTYGETYGMSDAEKAKRLINTGGPYVIQKSGAPNSGPNAGPNSGPTSGLTSNPASGPALQAPAAPVVSTLNCPAGTKDAGDGTCMITGDWKP